MFAIAIHGGAGTLPRSEMSAGMERDYRDGLAQALQSGFSQLESGHTSLDAVEHAVAVLEDNPLFNAGRGAVFTHDGHNELDAAIMDGGTLAAGAACGLTHIKNPVKLARKIMAASTFVMLNGAGAEEFAVGQGIEWVEPEYFYTEERWRQLQRILAGERGLSPLTISHVGTVGAVAVDVRGNLAAATSTGGMTGKRYGRIGDSPIIGAGTYADNRACAISATGHGERFIEAVVAHDICARIRYGSRSLHAAVEEVVHHELIRIHGEGGVIGIDTHANVEMQFNTQGMFRASRRQGEASRVAIYED